MHVIDWNSIIITLLGGTSILGFIYAIIYRKQNKQLKENEVKVSDASAQTEQINLGELFMQKSAEMFQKMQELQEETYKATLNNGKDNNKIIKKVDEIADMQQHIVDYLNGGFQDFLEKEAQKAEEDTKMQSQKDENA